MKRNLLLLSLCYLFLPQYTIAQSIHYTPFYTTPAALNPAFTGMFDGKIRTGMIYRDQWASITVPYVTLGLSADMPILSLKNGGYFAAGIQAMKDQAGDGNLSNFFAAGSFSYHKPFLRGKWLHDHPLDIGIGLQAAYSQSIIDVSALYFSSELYPDPVPQGFNLGIAREFRELPLSWGFSISQCPSVRFNYTLGVSVHNSIQGNELDAQHRTALGLDGYYSVVTGATWLPTQRLIISPAFMYIGRQTQPQWIGGTELAYIVSRKMAHFDRVALFAAGWYRTTNAITLNAGIEYKKIKLGLGYDRYPDANLASNGNGAVELSFRYIAPALSNKATRRNIPCNRF